jgi:hypothetical protein
MGKGREGTSSAGGAARVSEREGETMPLYLSKFSYTPETWARLISNPEDRRKWLAISCSRRRS